MTVEIKVRMLLCKGLQKPTGLRRACKAGSTRLAVIL